MSHSKLIKVTIIIFLILITSIGLYSYGPDIPLINKIPYFSNKHSHDYRPVFDEKGQIDYWTCAMHPSVRLDEPEKCPICGMDTTPVYKKGISKSGGKDKENINDRSSSNDLENMQGHDHSSHGTSISTRKSKGKEASSIFTVSPERQQLIGVKTEPVQMRQIERDIRTVGIVELDETKIEHIHTKISGWIENVFVDYSGQSVKEGEPIFSIYSPDLVSTQEEYLLALKSKKILEDSEFPEIAEAGKSLLNSSRRRLELWDISKSQINELERSGRVKENLVINSPITGIVMEKNVFENKHVNPEQTLYVIADHSTVWVQVDIYENEISLINLGDSAIMTLVSFPGEEFVGEVTFISPHIDQKTRTVKVRLEFENPDLKLLPEMYANVILKKPMGEKLTIPESSVLRTGKQDIVFVSKGDGILQIRKVMLGQKAGGYYEVTKGLNVGEKVISRANFLIDSESKVQAAIATWEHDSSDETKLEMNMHNQNKNGTEKNLDFYLDIEPKEKQGPDHTHHLH